MMLTGHQSPESKSKHRTKKQDPRNHERTSRHGKTRVQSIRPQMSPPPVPTAPPPIGVLPSTHAVSPSVRPSPLIKRPKVSPSPSDDDDDDESSPRTDRSPSRSQSGSLFRVSAKMSDHKNTRATSGEKVTEEHAQKSGSKTRKCTYVVTQTGTPQKGTSQNLDIYGTDFKDTETE